jgi:Flp pilus assembly protein TadG
MKTASTLLVNLRGIRRSGLLRDFGSDRRGVVAIIFGLALVPLLAGVGATVDYTRASAARDRLTMIADKAALEGISHASIETRRKLPDSGKSAIESLFRSEASRVAGVTLNEVNVVINDTGANRDVTIEYKASVRNHFGTMLNANTTPIRGNSRASVPFPFIDFYLMLDNSPSMGIGATVPDMEKMIAKTGCAFACHEAYAADRLGATYAPIKKKEIDAKLRIDVVREATEKLLERAIADQDSRSQFRIGIYTFNMAMQEIAPVTSNLSSVKHLAKNIQLVPFPSPGHNDYRYTNYSGLLPYVGYLPTGGAGASAATPKRVLFLVSDGVANEHGSPRVKPVPIELCNKIKNEKKFLIAALYTTYHPLPGNHAYEAEVAPIASKIGPAMQACASPGLFFEVAPGQGIAEAMQILFQKAVGEARLAR